MVSEKFVRRVCTIQRYMDLYDNCTIWHSSMQTSLGTLRPFHRERHPYLWAICSRTAPDLGLLGCSWSWRKAKIRRMPPRCREGACFEISWMSRLWQKIPSFVHYNLVRITKSSSWWTFGWTKQNSPNLVFIIIWSPKVKIAFCQSRIQ